MPLKIRSKVLCVDDDEDACEMLSELMNSFDIDASCARSAAAAWPLIKAKHFDAFILDAWLPGLDGFQFCQQLREFDPTTPILFYSGAAYEADKQNGIAAGANSYVTKPDIDCLINTMTDLIAISKGKFVVPVGAGKDAAPARTPLFGQFFSVKTASN
jgi:DNA-binding response OmpR family regulator